MGCKNQKNDRNASPSKQAISVKYKEPENCTQTPPRSLSATPWRSAVRQMDEMTQHNAALVEETNAAIEQTEAQANELDNIVDVFRIDDTANSTSDATAKQIAA